MISTSAGKGAQEPRADITLESFENEKKNQADSMQGCGSRVRMMYVAAASCLFLALTLGLASGYTAPAVYDMTVNPRSPVKPSEEELSWISSILVIGFSVGDVIAGFIVNKIGRKEALVFNIIPAGVGWLTVAYARSATTIIVGRFVTGLAAGTYAVAISAYCVEIATPEVRGILGSGVQGSLVTGHMISCILGSFIPWNYLALNGVVFTIVGISVFTLMPESPRWLIAQGRLGEAVRVMRFLHGDRLDAERECLAINEDLRSKPAFSLREVLDPTVWKPTLISIAIYFFVEFSGMTAIFSFSSEIFEASSDFIDPQNGTIVLAVVQWVATLSSNSVVDRVGRRPLLLASGGLMSASLLMMGTYYYYHPGGQSYLWVPLTSLALYVLAYAVGYGPVSGLLMAEMLPTKARSVMTGVVNVFNGLFGFAGIQGFNGLGKAIGTNGTFWLFGTVAALGVVFVALVVPETKGRKLEDIENMFRKRPASLGKVQEG